MVFGVDVTRSTEVVGLVLDMDVGKIIKF